MVEAAYDGVFGIPIEFVFTPSEGAAFASTVAQAQELTPADVKVEPVKFTPISGANSGNEQFVLGKLPSASVKIKATYGAAAHLAAQTALEAKLKGSLVVTYGDGASDTYAGAALTGLTAAAINADSLRTDDLEFTVSLPSVFATGA